jgi:hypothetical protein
MARAVASVLAPWQVTQHLFSNVTITIGGDHATTNHYLQATHVPDADSASEHADIPAPPLPTVRLKPRAGTGDRRLRSGKPRGRTLSDTDEEYSMKLSHIPLRVATGAYILNSGLSKQGLEGQAAEGLHAMAARAIPALKKIPATRFAQLLSSAEIALGGALLAPFVSSRIAGAALTGFSAGLVQLYMQTPGMRQEGSIKPTQDGIGLAKDVWLLGAGLTLLLDRNRTPKLSQAPTSQD